MCDSRVVQEICQGTCQFQLSMHTQEDVKFNFSDDRYTHEVHSSEITLLARNTCS